MHQSKQDTYAHHAVSPKAEKLLLAAGSLKVPHRRPREPPEATVRASRWNFPRGSREPRKTSCTEKKENRYSYETKRFLPPLPITVPNLHLPSPSSFTLPSSRHHHQQLPRVGQEVRSAFRPRKSRALHGIGTWIHFSCNCNQESIIPTG